MEEVFNVQELIWAVINFALFFTLLSFLFYKPMLKFLESRRNEIATNLERAESARKEAEELRLKYQEQLASAQREAEEILNKAVKAAEEVKADIVAKANSEAARLIEKAQERIQMEKEKVVSELRGEVASLAIMAAEKVIERELSAEDHKRLLGEFVKEVGGIH